jgi:hypothetical protein
MYLIYIDLSSVETGAKAGVTLTGTPEKLILAGKYEEFKGGELTMVSLLRWVRGRADMPEAHRGRLS